MKNFCKNLKLKIFQNEKELFENQYNCLVLWLLNQLKNPSEEFKLYLNTIPKSFEEYFYFWPKEDLKKVSNTIWFNEKYSTGFTDLNEIKDSIKKCRLKNNKFKNREIMRAELAVRSRNFGLMLGGKEYHSLAPFTDMFNFDPKFPNTVWKTKLKNEKDNFLLISTKAIKKNSEINLFYGYEDNANLFSAYGFTLKNNPFLSYTDYFVVKYRNKKFDNLSLDEKNSSHLVHILNLLKKFDEKKGIKIPKRDFKINEINLWKFLLKEIRSYKNEDIIRKIKNNDDNFSSKNNLTILRTLIAEDRLIETNTKFINEFISLINEGKDNIKKNSNSIVLKQNLKYFKDLFDKIDI